MHLDKLERSAVFDAATKIMAIVIDPLKAILTEFPTPTFYKDDTALLIIDMQYADASPGYGIVATCQEHGIDVSYYVERLALITKNIADIIFACRQKSIPIIYCVIESLTCSGYDRGLVEKLIDIHIKPNSKEGAILDEIKPTEDDIVLKKTCSGVFNGTNIDQLLHNMGIKNLIVTGVVTNQCVDTAVRDAADRGYFVTLLEDGCAALHPTLHEATLEILSNVYCKISTTQETIEVISNCKEK